MFLEYCKLRGYAANRIVVPQRSGRFPDYEMRVADQRIIAEIKELRANPEDKRQFKAMEENRIEVFGDQPGRRVRTHIEDAERQLRRYKAEGVPCIIILYDNILVGGRRVLPSGFWLEPYHVDVGMYGLQVVNLRLHPNGKPESLGDTRGKNRTLRKQHHSIVSAVAVLEDHSAEYGLFLMVYHNFFASIPLPSNLFVHAKDRQLAKKDPEASPGPWERI